MFPGLANNIIPTFLSHIRTPDISTADETEIKLTDILPTAGAAAFTTTVFTAAIFPTAVITAVCSTALPHVLNPDESSAALRCRDSCPGRYIS